MFIKSQFPSTQLCAMKKKENQLFYLNINTFIYYFIHAFYSQTEQYSTLQSYYAATKLNTLAEKPKASHLTLLIY